MCIDIILNFVDFIFQYGSGSIAPLVNIFEKVFECTDAQAYFDVDMGFVMFGKIWAIWDDPSIVEPYTFDFDFAHFSFNDFPPSINRITIFIRHSFIAKLPWIFLRAFSVFDTQRIQMCWTTWTMHHIV